MPERKVLGRGLSSLIPTVPPTALPTKPDRETADTAATVREISVADIRTNPRQPRRRFSEQALEELSQSIRENGLLQPLVVRRVPDGYELVAGERRLRASRRAGLKLVPVVLRKATDREQLTLALVENLQREDLNPIEEARGYDRLKREFGLTQEEVALRVGKERSTVANLLRLLKLSPEVQEMLATGALSMGHARALLPLEDVRRQAAMAHRIEKEGLSVRNVEAIIRKMTAGPAPKGRRAIDQKAPNVNLRHMADELQRSLGTRVEIVSRGRGGEIRVHYYTPEELRRLGDRFLESR